MSYCIGGDPQSIRDVTRVNSPVTVKNSQNVTLINCTKDVENQENKVFIKDVDFDELVEENKTLKLEIEKLKERMSEMKEIVDMIYFAPGGVHETSIKWKFENGIYEKELNDEKDEPPS